MRGLKDIFICNIIKGVVGQTMERRVELSAVPLLRGHFAFNNSYSQFQGRASFTGYGTQGAMDGKSIPTSDAYPL
jgi:hypothetical protein